MSWPRSAMKAARFLWRSKMSFRRILVSPGLVLALAASTFLVNPHGALAQSSGGGLDNFEQEILFVVSRARPFVVRIEAVVDPNRDPAAGRRQPAKLPPRRVGSGISISSDGCIVTTASIVDGATTIMVRTASGVPQKAAVLGIDRRTNIALISCLNLNVPAARLGDSSLAPPGARVVVVGSYPIESPLCSFGTIVLDRGLVWGYSEVEMLQISAPVKGVNSGSAVVNSEGRVVGMVCGVYDESGTSGLSGSGSGMSGYIYRDRVAASPHDDAFFALPIEKVLDIAAEIKDRGRVDRGFLGIIVQKDERSPTGRGVIVRDILRGGPASLAGIEVGDVILQYEGRDLSIGDDLTFLVTATRPGSQVKFQVQRGNERPRVLDVVIGRAPNSYAWLPRELDPSLPAEQLWPPSEGEHDVLPNDRPGGSSPLTNKNKKP